MNALFDSLDPDTAIRAIAAQISAEVSPEGTALVYVVRNAEVIEKYIREGRTR